MDEQLAFVTQDSSYQYSQLSQEQISLLPETGYVLHLKASYINDSHWIM